MEVYYLLSIDPGIKGFISIIKLHNNYITPIKSVPIPINKIKIGKNNRVRVHEESLSILISELITEFNVLEVIIEKQQAVSKQGITSTGTTMEHFGFLKGLLRGMGINYKVVHSKTWQSIYPNELAKNKELNTKQRSEQYCLELYPNYNLKKTSRCTTISDGLTDSLLIGTWAARQLLLNNN